MHFPNPYSIFMRDMKKLDPYHPSADLRPYASVCSRWGFALAAAGNSKEWPRRCVDPLFIPADGRYTAAGHAF